MNSPLHTAAIRKLFSVMYSCRSECIMRDRQAQGEKRWVWNKQSSHSLLSVSCWLCFLLCVHSQCTLLIRQLLSSYSESSIPALLHPTLLPNLIPRTSAENTCTILDYFPNKFWLELYYHLFNISVPPPTPSHYCFLYWFICHAYTIPHRATQYIYNLIPFKLLISLETFILQD